MGEIKKNNIRKSDIITASEIGQYQYCSQAWFLQKCGYKPKSPMLDVGLKKHENLGKILYYTEICDKKWKTYLMIGFLLFIIAIIIILFEVV